jgi:hypothetical protein
MGLSDNTKKTYKILFERFKDRSNVENVDSLSPERIIKLVKSIYPDSEKSSLLMLSAIQHFFKSEKMNKDTIFKMEKISRKISDLNNSISKIEKKGRYSKDELKKYVKWDDIEGEGLKYINDKSNKTLNRLIVGLYVIIPPRRADYWNLEYKKGSEEKLEKGKNYLVDTPKGLIITLGDYKTVKTHGIITIKLYKSYKKLEDLFLEFIKEEGLNYGDKVFSKFRLNSSNTFSKKVNSLFSKITNRDVGINILRHSFINDFLSVPRSLEERENIGLIMGHNTTTQLLYDKKDSKGDIPE